MRVSIGISGSSVAMRLFFKYCFSFICGPWPQQPLRRATSLIISRSLQLPRILQCRNRRQLRCQRRKKRGAKVKVEGTTPQKRSRVNLAATGARANKPAAKEEVATEELETVPPAGDEQENVSVDKIKTTVARCIQVSVSKEREASPREIKGPD